MSLQNNQDTQQNLPRKGMNKDLALTFLDEDTLLSMRNGLLFNHQGEFLSAQTEQSNTLVCTLPYPLIGYTKLPDGNWCLFLSDDINSEIGTFSESNYKYSTLLNKQWLNFNRANLITAKSKQNWDGTFQIYWADKRRNPDRTLNLSLVNDATPDSIRLAKLITPPIVGITKGSAGTLPNGSYEAIIRYAVNNQPFGDFYSLTLPVSIFHEDTISGSLDVTINHQDNDFPGFQLVIIQERDNTTSAKSVGFYSSKTKRIHVTTLEKSEGIDLAVITAQNIPWIASDRIESNNKHIFRVGTETIPEVNYAQMALDIKVQFTVTQAPANYYSYGNEIGYYRDEAYLPFIQLLHKTGYWSSAFPTGAREPTGSENGIASGNDVYEMHINSCEGKVVKKNWEVNNTAGKMIPISSPADLVCDTKLIGYGEMGYYESTDTYPDNPVYGKWANKPIVVPKFPDEEKCPRYSVIDGKPYINILGWQFSNIQQPVKADGTPDTDWVGYRIIRADRRNNKSVICRGLLTNVRSYKEKQGSDEVDIMYTNYPVNDLSPDQFISSKLTYYKGSKERDFDPVKDYYTDRYTLYSPHTTIRRQALGSELKIESEEIAEVTGEFVPTYQHPRHKLLSMFSFWIAAALGATEALLTTLGKNTYHSETDTEKDVSLIGGVKNTQKFGKDYPINSVEDLIGLDIIGWTKDAIQALAFGKIASGIKEIILVLASLGLKVLTFTFFGIKYADSVIDIIWNYLGYTNYALQYNCHAAFKQSQSVGTGYKRRYITEYQYLEAGLQTISGGLYNNFGKHNVVYVAINSPLGTFRNTDNSRTTIKGFGIGDDIVQKTRSTGVAYYATSKVSNPNQYGRIESNTRFLLTHNNYFTLQSSDGNANIYSTGPVWGGDCYINRFTIQTKHQFFTQNQAGPNFKDEEQFDYRLYRNIGYPRFWINTFKYDFSELITKDVGSFSKMSSSVKSRHNLDNKGKDTTNVFRVDNAYFYTSSNGVLDFFVESDYNLDYRQKPKSNTFFYSDKFSSLSEIFRSDRLLLPEEFNYDTSLNKQPDEFFAQVQPINYDPAVYDRQYKYNRNRLIWSLPAFREQQYDNWQYFLTANEFTFSLSEFGNLVSLHRLDGERLLFLFDRSSPYVLAGRSELQVSERTVTIGDGGLFALDPVEIMHTEQHYGSCQSSFAASSTPYGTFYVSERQGRLFNFSGQLDDLTRNGLHMWSKQYLPIQLTKSFPDYLHSDNPIIGVGYTISVDTSWDLIYISKRDFIPKEGVIYDSTKDAFYSSSDSSNPISISNSDYFYDVSFTLSYSPTLKAFVSFHDWVPDLVLPTENHFITSKGTSLYLHNSNPYSYCNFYGKQYPFEIEYGVSTKMKVDVLRSLEYYLECYHYKDERNRVHLKNENFDKLIVRNSEQISGLLTLVPSTGNPYTDIWYPIPNVNGADILFSKVENKYRIDQFSDITRDRMADVHLMHINANGYTQIINPAAIDPFKHPYEKQPFRHYQSIVWLAKENPGAVMMVLRLSLTKLIESER